MSRVYWVWRVASNHWSSFSGLSNCSSRARTMTVAGLFSANFWRISTKHGRLGFSCRCEISPYFTVSCCHLKRAGGVPSGRRPSSNRNCYDNMLFDITKVDSVQALIMKNSTPARSINYPSDLTDTEWEIVSSIITEADPYTTGRPRTSDLREIYWSYLRFRLTKVL